MCSLKGKRLLVLGANPETIPLILTAKNLGVYVIVTDFNPEAIAKEYADKSFNIDGMDVDSLKIMAKSENVDGVIVGVADRLIVPYQQLCSDLGLPCYGTREQCEIFTDKEKFNQKCELFGLHAIPNYNPDLFSQEDIQYPVLVKPVDGNSGKGIFICHNILELRTAIEKSKLFSRRKRVLIERYMDCDDMFICYTFIDGKVIVSATADRYTTRDQGDLSRVCIGAVYPSRHSELYFEKVHQKICKLFNELNVSSGIFLISAFVEDNNIYLYDPGFRLQGEAPNIFIEALGGYDQKELLINYALCGSMGQIDLNETFDYNFNGKIAATLWFLCKEGVIDNIEGLVDLENDKSVIAINRRMDIGYSITKEMIGTESQVFARVYIVADNKDSLREKVDKCSKSVKVRDGKGEDMLLSTIMGKSF